MANGTATITVDAKLAEAYNAAPKTRQKKALSAMRQALRTMPTRQSVAPRLSKKESRLLLKINRGLSAAQYERLQELNDKLEFSTVTAEEHAELLQLADLAEQLTVERLQAVLAIAKLRKVAPAEMMRQLGMTPGSSAKLL
jgi:hypothetical protein